MNSEDLSGVHALEVNNVGSFLVVCRWRKVRGRRICRLYSDLSQLGGVCLMATFGVEGITPDCEVCRRIVEVLVTGNLSPSIKNLAVGNLKRHGKKSH